MPDPLTASINCMELSVDEFIHAAITLANRHNEKGTWKTHTPRAWAREIHNEVEELKDAVRGRHEHPAELELLQIVSASINMYRNLYARID